MFVQKFTIRRKVSNRTKILIITAFFLSLYGLISAFSWYEHRRIIKQANDYIDKGILVSAKLLLKKYLKNNEGSLKDYELVLKILKKERKYNKSVELHAEILKTIMFLYEKKLIGEQTYHSNMAEAYFHFGPLYYERFLKHVSQIDLEKISEKKQEILLKMSIIANESLGNLEKLIEPLKKLSSFDKKNVPIIVRLARSYVMEEKFVLAREILEESFSLLIKSFEKNKSKKKDLLILSYCLIDVLDRMGLIAEKNYYNVMLNYFIDDISEKRDLHEYLSARKKNDDLFIFAKNHIKPLKNIFFVVHL